MHHAAFTLALLCIAISGCTVGGNSSVAKENDRLRRVELELSQRIAQLETQLSESRAQTAAASINIPAETASLVPRITGVSISQLSGFEPVDISKPATSVVAYITFEDGRGRFTQGIGNISAFATHKGQKVAAIQLAPDQLVESYRSGITGTYYLLTLPLAQPIQRTKPDEVILHVTFTDSLTGLTHTLERTITR